MKMTTRTLLLSSLALAITGCESNSKQAPPTGEPAHSDVAPRAGQARRASPPPVSAPPIAKPSGRDVMKLQACQIVPGADVAKITGGKLISPSNTKGPLCGYVLEKDGKTISYQLRFFEPMMFESMFDAAPAGQLGDKVDGAWNIGYIDKGMAAGTYALSAVWRGDVAMEAQGDGKEPVIALAKLAASHMPAR